MPRRHRPSPHEAAALISDCVKVQAVIRTLQADEHQRGCLMEERVLKGDLKNNWNRQIRETHETETS